MHWIVQNNVFNEVRYAEVLQTLERGGIPHVVVKVIPFGGGMEPEPEVENPIAVIGSYALVKEAHKRGWGPGVFYSGQINFEVYAEHYGPHLLNVGARVLRFADISLSEPSFIRPVDDGKAFAGTVIAPAELSQWQERIASIDGYKTVHEDLRVVVAPLREIYAEYRFFVVERQIVAGTRYKLGDRLSPSAEVPEDILEAARRMVSLWQPDRAFVIDLALTPEGPKVIELNNINSAGWYHADVSKVIQAIDRLAPA